VREVNRYDAVHLRYEDSNIRYGEGCEVEVVTASDYAALEAEFERLRETLYQERIAEDEQRRQLEAAQENLAGYKAERAALHAEVEALRAALLGIASVNPAERGIEWAKSYASDGLNGAGSELYARWLDTFKEAEALRAENAALRESSQDVRSLVEALEECAASLAWNCFGECRAIHAGPIMPAAMALDTARAALSTHRQAQRQ